MYDYYLEHIWHRISVERKERGKERREIGERGGRGRESEDKKEGRKEEGRKEKGKKLMT